MAKHSPKQPMTIRASPYDSKNKPSEGTSPNCPMSPDHHHCRQKEETIKQSLTQTLNPSSSYPSKKKQSNKASPINTMSSTHFYGEINEEAIRPSAAAKFMLKHTRIQSLMKSSFQFNSAKKESNVVLSICAMPIPQCLGDDDETTPGPSVLADPDNGQEQWLNWRTKCAPYVTLTHSCLINEMSMVFETVSSRL